MNFAGLSIVEGLKFNFRMSEGIAHFTLFCRFLVLQKLGFGSTKIWSLSLCFLKCSQWIFRTMHFNEPAVLVELSEIFQGYL